MWKLFLLLTLVTQLAHSQEMPISEFNKGSLSHWSVRSFAGHTDYQLLEGDKEAVLQAQSNGAASGLVMEKRIDLADTPYMNWSWLSQSSLKGMDEQSKQGDDYVARVYVVIDGGWQFWQTQALNYVWSSNQPQFSHWNNAFTGKATKMIAIRGMDSALHTWFSEKRNVYQDLITYFGDQGSEDKNLKAYRYIDAIALMTDSDNSASEARALYGEIWFSRQ